MTGLLYEVAFSKLLGYIFGATAYAVSAVLAAFMAGLAAGAHFGGRRASHLARPLVGYGVLEIGVGVVCAITPGTFGLLTDAYVAAARAAPGSLALLTAVRAALAGLVVILPTIAMGATLPILSRRLVGTEDAERRLPTLYALNTAGGAVGSVVSAYVLLPTLGIVGTIWAAALANGVIGVIAIALGRREAPLSPVHVLSEVLPKSAELKAEGESVHKAEGDSASKVDTAKTSAEATESFDLPFHLALAFASGLLVFAAEVVQTHLLALLIGNSAYAFGIMLAAFLVCLSIGAARAPALAKKYGSSALVFGLAAASLAFAITLPLWDRTPLAFAFFGKYVTSWTGRELVRAGVALLVLAPSTLCMGTTFPLLLTRVAKRRDVAALVGRLTVANTLGTIVGSIATGYFILPALGSEKSLVLVAITFAILSALAARRGSQLNRTQARNLAFVAGISVILAIFVPRWDMGKMTSGANVYFTMGPAPDKLEMVSEDVHGGVTTVARRGDILTMYTNGKFQGDNGFEMAAQRRFAHFPSLFLKNENRALVIGLGTGTTLGTVAAYPFGRIDVVEISPAIVEASRRFYAEQSFFALDDPRVHLAVNDGRNFLLVTTEPYDLITIELSSVWFAGASSLYSHEFYKLIHSRLTQGGVLQQWVQLHHIRRRELATIIRTLRAVFPHVALFEGGAQGILVASQQPLKASESKLAEFDASDRLKATLAGKRLVDTIDELVTSGEDLDRFVKDSESDGGPILSTDDNLYLEYATPKGNVLSYVDSLNQTMKLLHQYQTKDCRARHLVP
ncbi:MAG: fused MFS/spermidine synthase [Polyangiaceae bacterium]|nr:fused MFS/spermidine synthase [Polyangiaceae bacterium]